MLIQTEARPVKSETWQHWTPNEVYADLRLSQEHLGLNYRKVIDLWMRKYRYTAPRKWFEIRVMKENSLILPVQSSKDWWKDPAFMDKIFWVYQKPMRIKYKNTDCFVYVLEFMECQRVEQLLWQRIGRKPFRSDYPLLFVPVDCAEHAWNERSGGYSDHLRPRPEVVLTQEEIDKDGEVEEAIKKIKLIADEEMSKLAPPTPLEKEMA